jgi:Glucose / Sorbosone dehydrogenase
MRTRAAAVVIAAAAALLALPGTAGALQAFHVGDFPSPTYVTAPPGDVHRLFVVEKAGVIELLHDGERRQFLTFDPSAIATSSEQGLLSMAFAPDYATSGLFYVYYSDPSGDGNLGTLAEFRRSTTDPDVADPASKRVLFTVDHTKHESHNGGQLQFGPDGLLYLSTGDGGASNDPDGNGQNTASRLAKILRIDPRDRAAVPAMFAFGLRNPWRFSFDRLTGDLVIADVGQGQREEIDFLPKGSGLGSDFGWHCAEGDIATPGVTPCTPLAPYVPPLFAYDHSDGDCSITGGYVVRTHELESVYGRYLYADYCLGDVRSIKLAAGSATGDASTGVALTNVQTFGEDACANIYAGTGDSQVVELAEDGIEAPPPCTVAWKPPGEQPPPTPKDRTPPHVKVERRFRQSLGELRSLFLTVRCNERCGASVSARIAIPGSKRQLEVPAVTRTLAARTSVRLRLLLRPRQAQRVRDALGRGSRVRGTLRVAARDAAGNETVKTKPVLVLP